jgi:hypothetical protein
MDPSVICVRTPEIGATAAGIASVRNVNVAAIPKYRTIGSVAVNRVGGTRHRKFAPFAPTRILHRKEKSFLAIVWLETTARIPCNSRFNYYKRI